MTLRFITLFTLPLFISFGQSFAQEPEIDAKQMPRIPATEPAEALKKFEIKPGFKIELAAAEPNVVDPIAMCFDEEGALFILEMRGYSERRDDELGRVRKLVDKDDDGVFETATVYVDQLKWPTALTCYKGGVFVGATPDLFYCKDNDGDGVADTKETIFTGFGEGQLKLNMQALFNSLRWGPDNRIWGCTSRNGGKVHRVGESPDSPLLLRGSDFSFDPEKFDLRAENGTGQYGMCFDSKDRRFTCSNSNHIIWLAYERHHFKSNPLFSMPSAMVSIPDDGSAAPVFRTSEDEPWRIVRTRWRVSGVVKGIVEGGGRVSGYFTSATGVTLYWGDAFAPEFRDNAFIGDVGSNLVHRKLVNYTDGQSQPVATRPADEKDTEFLRSTDNWFRPCNFANGPDGALYIADMYRETIEHPWSLPEGIKKHLDLNSGNDRGRIWRVVPEKHNRRQIPNLGKASDEELGKLLTHPNDWHRTTARRLLFERGKPVPVSPPSSDSFLAHLSNEAPDFSLLSKPSPDRWKEAAVLNALRTPEQLALAWKDHRDHGSTDFRKNLISMIGKSKQPKAIDSVIDTISKSGISEASAAAIKSLAEAGVSFDSAGKLAPTFEMARATIAKGESNPPAMTFLRNDRSKEAGAIIRQVVASPEAPESLRGAAIAALGSRRGGVGELLVRQWQSFSPALKNKALEAAFKHSDSSLTLLKAIGDKKILATDIPPTTANALRSSRISLVKDLAISVLPVPKVVSRADVVASYQPALKIEGDPVKGLAVYQKACMSCHKSPEGQGFNVGPDFATFKNAGPDSIIGNIFDPNKEVAPQFQAFSFTLQNGETILGMIESENTTDMTIKMIGGVTKTFPRKDVQSMKGIGQSLMPVGLEATLTIEEIADLLAYIAK